MALIIVISIGDFQIHWNVLSLWPFGLSHFYHNYLISNDCIRHSGKITILQHIIKTFFIQQHDFLCRVLIE